MTKTFIIVCFLLFLVSCNQNNELCKPKAQKNSPSSHPQSENLKCTNPVNDPQPELPQAGEVEGQVVDDELDSAVYLFDANVRMSRFDKKGEEKVLRALNIIKQVIRTKEFKERVVHFTYKGEKKFVDNLGLSNEEIYLKILDGSEEMNPGVNHTMDLDLELYYSNKNIVGYTYPNVLKIWMNRKYFDVYSASEVAGNIFHEWSHKLGFDHAVKYTASRDSSVPYALGYIMEELGKKFE